VGDFSINTVYINSIKGGLMQKFSNLESLLTRHDIWRGHNRSIIKDSLTTQYPELDDLLCGGWPRQALVEANFSRHGIGELSLILPTLVKHTQKEGLCVLLDPPYQPYAPSWASAGIKLENLFVIHSKCRNEWLWSAEHSIRSEVLLVAWIGQYKFNYSNLRRIQLAATENYQPAFLYNHLKRISLYSPAALRLEINNSKLHEIKIKVIKFNGLNSSSQVRLKTYINDTKRILLHQLPVPIHNNHKNTGLPFNPNETQDYILNT
tara:strand:+ start:1532 stop:2323 length:792 start_codon:yes stop_codon:yes gene_type:complete